MLSIGLTGVIYGLFQVIYAMIAYRPHHADENAFSKRMMVYVFGGITLCVLIGLGGQMIVEAEKLKAAFR